MPISSPLHDTSDSPTPTSSPVSGDAFPPGFRSILIALWIGTLFAPFLMSSVTAVLPAIGADLHATTVHLSLIMVIYSLAQAIFNTIGGRFGDLWGLRRMLLLGVALFTVFTIIMGFVNSIESMLVLRFLQGGAAAIISCCTTAIAVSMSPLSRRGQVMGFLTTAVYLGLTLGPLVGGVIGTWWSWRWLFLGIFVPGVAVWLVLRINLKQEWRAASGETLDVPGMVWLTLGLGLLTVGAGCVGIMRALLWLTLPGVLCLVIFIRRQWHIPYPLVDVRMFGQSHGFAAGLLATVINYGSTMGLIFFFSIYLQQVRGFSPFEAGMVLMLQSMAQVVFSPVGGKLADKLGAEPVAATGMALCGLGIIFVATLGKDTSLYLLYSAQVVLGIGVGLFNAPNMVATLSHVQGKHLAVASGLMGSMRTMGGLFSQVFISLMIGHYMGNAVVTPDNSAGFLVAMEVTLYCLAGLNICGVALGIYRTVKDFKSKG